LLDLSPDGQWALAGVGNSPGRLDLLPCGAGTARTIPTEDLEMQNAQWFPDGAIYPVDGGTPKSVPGFVPSDRTIRWSTDGKAIYAFTRGELPGRVFRIDIDTGERKLWKELSPPDPTGLEGLTAVRMSHDEQSFAYSFAQRLNDLFVVEGLSSRPFDNALWRNPHRPELDVLFSFLGHEHFAPGKGAWQSLATFRVSSLCVSTAARYSSAFWRASAESPF